jgi:FkbM family methyltransferase
MLQHIGRLYPFYSGGFSLVNSARLQRFLSHDDEPKWCTGPGGQMLVPLGDAVGKCIYYTGDYDRKITWICRKLLRPGDTALDIGANLGVVALAMAKQVGPSGVVHAFEPNPSMQRFIEASIQKCRYKQVKLHKTALGSEQATLDLFIPKTNFGKGSLILHRDDANVDVVSCPVERLDDISDRENIQSVRLVKIDVEGFEPDVLRGATRLISNARPDAIIMETNEESNLDFRQRPAILILLDLNYRFVAIPKAMFSMRVEEFDINIHEAPSHDVLAIAEEKYSSVMESLQR